MDLTPARQPATLKLLFWLKWKLTLRGYQRNTTAIWGVILSLVGFLPLMALAAGGSYLGYVSLPPPYPEHLLRAVLMGIYLFWLISPMMGFAVNESFDVTKLFVYPIAVRQMLVGAIAGSVLDFPVIFLMPTLLAALAGFGHTIAALIVEGLALLLFLGHTLSLGQSIVLATSGMLRSRRYRDLLMVLFPLIWIVYYVVTQMMQRGSIRIDWNGILRSRTWEIANYLPPGITSRAVVAADRGEFLIALGWCGLLAAVTVGTVLLASSVIQKVYTGDSDRIAIRGGSRPETRPTPAAVDERSKGADDVKLFLGIKLPPAAEAVYLKEIRYMMRDPSFKQAFMNLIYTLVVAVFMVLPREERNLPIKWLAWPASLVVLMSEMRFFFNLLGAEGAAAPLFFLFPASRRQMLVGKNAAYLQVFVPINVALTFIICLIPSALDEFPYIVFWTILATGFFVAAGNLISVLFPMRVVMKGWKVRQASVGQGCAYGFLYLGVSLGAFLALMPVIAAIALPRLWLGNAWLWLTLPIAVGYVVGIYFVALRLSERLLLQRELEIMTKLGAEE